MSSTHGTHQFHTWNSAVPHVELTGTMRRGESGERSNPLVAQGGLDGDVLLNGGDEGVAVELATHLGKVLLGRAGVAVEAEARLRR